MNVLLATDLSEAGLKSVEGLCACGATGFERVTLLHVIDLDQYTAGGSIPGITEWAHEELGKAAAKLRKRGFAVDIRVETGPVIDTIKTVAGEIGIDLVVATNLGKGAVVGRLLGSTAERLPIATNLPVLIERVEHDGEQWCRLGSASPFQRILLGVDLDDGDVRALVSRVAGLPGIESLRVVHVVQDETGRVSAREGLGRSLSGIASGIALESAVAVGDAAAQLLVQAQDFDATAIAIAACRHGMMHRGVLGSVARTIALHADRAVLLLPSTSLRGLAHVGHTNR